MMTRKKKKEKSVENNRRGKKEKNTLWAVFIFLLVLCIIEYDPHLLSFMGSGNLG